MKIYFAGSIRGGRDDQEAYLQLIQHIGKYGQVLTEHLGDKNLGAQGEDKHTDDWIYKRDMAWVREADVIIAEVSTPSLGVGYELGKAEDLGKRILCLYRPQPEKRLSAMLVGNSNLQIRNYETIEEARIIIDEFFK